MKKRILLVTRIDGFSGTSAHLFSELKKHCEITECIDPFYIPFFKKYLILVKSFRFDKMKWQRRFRDDLSSYHRSSLAFKKRTELYINRLEKVANEYDLIFQFSSSLIPSEEKHIKPYAIYVDRTIKMNEKYSPELLKTYNSSEQRKLHNLHKKAFSMADIIFTFNNPTSNSVINDYHTDQKKVVTVGSGVNLPELPDIDKNDSNLILTVCSNFERQKGQLSIDSFNLVRNEFPDAKFILVGKKLKNDRQISSFTSLPHDKLMKLHRDAAIVIQPGLLGGMQTITEAMANKCVCIANAENPYISDLISNKNNGFLVQTVDPREIAELIRMILQNKKLKKTIGQNAYKHIVDNYTWESVISRINTHLDKIM